MTTTEDALDQASRWIVRQDKAAADAATDERLDAWLAADTQHHIAFARIRDAWNRMDMLRRMRPLDGRDDMDLFGSREHPVRRHALRLAAVSGIAALAAVAVWLGPAQPSGAAYATTVGERSHLTLDDGSTVELNTNSSVSVRYTAEVREVTLERGEALFNVDSDAQRPFRVLADGVVARALGTEYSVRLREAEVVEVLVVKGRVVVMPGDGHEELNAGDRAVITESKHTVLHVGSADVQRRLAWTHDRIDFAGERLSEAVGEVNRYNHRQLTIADPGIAALQVRGIFRTNDPLDFVQALGELYGVRAFSSGDEAQPLDLRLVGTSTEKDSDAE